MSELTDKLKAMAAFEFKPSHFSAPGGHEPSDFIDVQTAADVANEAAARLTPLLEALLECVDRATELLDVESEINGRKIVKVGEDTYYPIGGNYKRNAVNYSLDQALARLQVLADEGA